MTNSRTCKGLASRQSTITADGCERLTRKGKRACDYCSPQWLSSYLNSCMCWWLGTLAKHPGHASKGRTWTCAPASRKNALSPLAWPHRDRGHGREVCPHERCAVPCPCAGLCASRGRSPCRSRPSFLAASQGTHTCDRRVLVNPHVQHSSATYSRKKKATHSSKSAVAISAK